MKGAKQCGLLVKGRIYVTLRQIKVYGETEKNSLKSWRGLSSEGLSDEEAERRAWAPVNKMNKGGKDPGGSGREKVVDKSPRARGWSEGSTRQSNTEKRPKENALMTICTVREASPGSMRGVKFVFVTGQSHNLPFPS